MDKDKQCWQDYIAGVQPLGARNHTAPLQAKNTSKKIASRCQASEQHNTPATSDLQRLIETVLEQQPLATAALLRYKSRRAVRRDVACMRRATKGILPICQVLDLHGMTVTQSKNALLEMCLAMHAHGDTYLHLIHGKGTATLKKHLLHWLPRLPFVVAAYSIVDAQLQSGALLVQCKW